MKTIVVNLFGVPGSGKSTGAAFIFARLKMAGVNAELITEFAKDKVWEENPTPFQNQAYIFGNQSYRLGRCDGKVDVIVTDSPLPLSIIYKAEERLTDNFDKTVLDVFNSYHNMSYLLRRVKPYNPVGRHQTEDGSNALGEPIVQLLKSKNIPYKEIDGSECGYLKIVNDVMCELRLREVQDE